MPYKDPDKRRLHAQTQRDRFYVPPSLEVPARYYVIQRPNGVELSSIHGGANTICGPVTLAEAVAAYVKAGGLAADLGLEPE